MPTIKNALWSPLTLDLGGRALRLDPRKTEDISDAELQAPGLQRHLLAGDVYLLPQSEGADKKTRGKG